MLNIDGFSRNIRPYVDEELRAALDADMQGQAQAAFAHLERAHILGQTSTVQHVRVHWHMFVWGWRHRSVKECLGQLLRIGGAAMVTAVGLVPLGNTGGTSASPFKSMPVPPDLAALIQQARTFRG